MFSDFIYWVTSNRIKAVKKRTVIGYSVLSAVLYMLIIRTVRILTPKRMITKEKSC